ncbi:MAG TPA: hypothetical protein PK295_04690 [Candidatus Magasanikbacteria bacterium]|nr:hypothetical protein [Candidatus Magasanikbacteria bacterium]
MKPRADENEQPQVSTYLFNIQLTDKPLEFKKGMAKKRLEKLLEECTPKGEELIHALMRIKSVRKVNISEYEVEVIFTEYRNSVTRRETIAALMKAVGGTLKVAPEHVIMTTDASRGEDIKPYIDPPIYED